MDSCKASPVAAPKESNVCGVEGPDHIMKGGDPTFIDGVAAWVRNECVPSQAEAVVEEDVLTKYLVRRRQLASSKTAR